MNTRGDAAPGHRLALRGVSHRYGSRGVLHEVGFEVAPGELLCLVGPSGCGKSTLLRLIAGLEPVQAGAIALDGVTIADPRSHLPPERRDIGLVFQDFALFPHLSVLDNVAFGLRRLPRARRREAALHALQQVGLAERAGDAPHVLSGGQQQRVALARAMAPQPRLLLLDEPFSNLDVRLRHRLRWQTRALLKDSRTASILVTHDPDEAMFMADRIALLQAGHLVQIGSPEALYRQPAGPFAAEFFGDLNRLSGVVLRGEVATPLGPIAARGHADGTPVQVLIRPEAIRLAAAGQTAAGRAQLQAWRMLGAIGLATLRVGDTLLQAQLDSRAAPAPGTVVELSLDPAGVFVFAAPGGAAHQTMP